MTKDDFKNNAGSKDGAGKTDKAGTTGAGAVRQSRPLLLGPRMPMMGMAPKPPFGMPVMPPVAKHVKPLPQAVAVKKADPATEGRDDDV